MAVSVPVVLLMVTCILGSAVANSPLAAPSPSPVVTRRSTDSPSASPLPAHAPTKHTPPASSPSPSVVEPPSAPSDSPVSPSPSVALPPSPNYAPQPSKNGAVINRLGFASAAAGFLAIAFMA